MTGFGLDIAANRQASKWTRKELMGRALWEIVGTRLFAWSPRPAWGWRRFILRVFRARIGQHVHLFPSVRIAIPWNLDLGDHVAIGDGAILYSLGLIKIGASSTVSQYAHLCAGSHDFRRPDMLLTKPPITIGSCVWICADAFIGPGVEVEDFAIVGARAVVVRNVVASSIVVGNPARQIGMR